MTLQKKKILFLIRSLRGGGAERVFATLLRYLDRNRFEPHLALLETVGPNLNDLPEDIPIHDLGVSRARYVLPAIVRLMWKLRPEMVFSTAGPLNLILVLARPFGPRGTKLLLRESTIPSVHLAQDVPLPKLWKWLYRSFYGKADKIVCQSDCMLTDLAENFKIPREKMVRIYNPVDSNRVRELADAGGNPFSGLGPHFVAAGRLSHEKGLDLLLDAMALIVKTLSSAQLTILGEGPLRANLELQRQKLGLTNAVHFLGYMDNPYPFFKYANIFVLPSRYEGLPNVLLEALALGSPIVAADCPGGAGEILRRFFKGVFICDQDPRFMAETIISVYLSNRQDRRENFADMEALDTEFGVARAVAAYEELFSV